MSAYPHPNSFDGRVLTQLQKGKKLTVLQVFQEFGIPSLRESVCRLRRAGFPIMDKWIPCQGDAHRPRQYKAYFIESPSNAKPEGGF